MMLPDDMVFFYGSISNAKLFEAVGADVRTFCWRFPQLLRIPRAIKALLRASQPPSSTGGSPEGIGHLSPSAIS